MGAAVYRGNRYRGKGKGKWREADGGRQLQTAIQPGVMPPSRRIMRTAGAEGANLGLLFAFGGPE